MKKYINRIKAYGIGLTLILITGCGQNSWKTVETPNLTIHYKSGSFAEKNLEEVKKVYEYSFHSAERSLPNNIKQSKVKVFLYDKLKSKGFSKVHEREVHYRYSEEFQLTTRHEFMHIFLYELNPNAPLRLEEGVCRHAEGKRKRFKGQVYDIMYYQLVKFVPEERWTVAEVFQDQYKDDDEGNIAAVFTLFAKDELGKDRFWSFYQDLDKSNWREQLTKYFSKTIEVINQEFKEYVHTIPDPPEAFRIKYSAETARLHK